MCDNILEPTIYKITKLLNFMISIMKMLDNEVNA